MKITRAYISNLATFPYHPDLHDRGGVNFPAITGGDINIFIGPNGAGKSTFLDIVQQLRSVVYFQRYMCDPRRVLSIGVEATTSLIRYMPLRLHRLHANHTGKGKPSFVFLDLTLNAQDRKGLQFVYEHQQEINDLIATYSQSTFRFAYTGLDSTIHTLHTVTQKVQIDTSTMQARQLDQHATPVEKLFYDYCTYFHLIQYCISIHNILHPEPGNHWHVLHGTFGIVGSFRDLLHFSDTYTIGQSDHEVSLALRQDDELKSIKMSQDHLLGLLYVKKKISHYIYDRNPHATAFEIDDMLSTLSLYVDLQLFCKKYLRRSLIVAPLENDPQTYRFSLMNDAGEEFMLDELSAGEKSMLSILSTVYGFHLQSGMLIVDEPELHLHPQLQKQFLALLEEIAQRFELQIIMTTHSSLMINDKNIKNVYRFHLTDGVTQIVTPGERYNEDTSKLMQILKFTNTAKIFFVKKIIMVEGETDEYAFGYYLQYLAQHDKERGSRITDYEIVNINGKGGYARWKKFLNSFGIESYFIGDWDNIQEAGGEPLDMTYYTHQILRGRRAAFENKSDKYKAVITYLKSHEPHKWEEIYETITKLYDKHVFILQQGDIEAYLGMHEKGLEETVQFIAHEFVNRMDDERFDDEREELNGIFKKIFLG